MSLVSATRLVGGFREYTYRGFQQLPLVIGSTSLLFTIATGSIAHANLTLGMGVLMPLYTVFLQNIFGWLMNYIWKDSIFWKRASGDTCRIIPDFSRTNKLAYYVPEKGNEYDGSVPSYWLMSIAFFIGYSISNAVDSLQTPAEAGSNEINHEKRNHHAVIVIVTTVIFSIVILLARYVYMSGCEGVAGGGIFLSILAAAGAAVIGYGMYTLSRQCGARSSDLFGILSQILPLSTTKPRPVVCTAQDM
uniref:Uncharacterized protein n=1 Tax=viral metagenome TaxID=1070528 RepID=A0A6C0ANR2_9ZZZZ